MSLSTIFQPTVRDTDTQPASEDVPVDFGLIKCLYPNCEPPEAVAPEEQERPTEVPLYSDPGSWGREEDGAAAGWWNADNQLGSGVPDDTAVRVEIYRSNCFHYFKYLHIKVIILPNFEHFF